MIVAGLEFMVQHEKMYPNSIGKEAMDAIKRSLDTYQQMQKFMNGAFLVHGAGYQNAYVLTLTLLLLVCMC
jgi:hypothetical protein